MIPIPSNTGEQLKRKLSFQFKALVKKILVYNWLVPKTSVLPSPLIADTIHTFCGGIFNLTYQFCVYTSRCAISKVHVASGIRFPFQISLTFSSNNIIYLYQAQIWNYTVLIKKFSVLGNRELHAADRHITRVICSPGRQKIDSGNFVKEKTKS